MTFYELLFGVCSISAALSMIAGVLAWWHGSARLTGAQEAYLAYTWVMFTAGMIALAVDTLA